MHMFSSLEYLRLTHWYNRTIAQLYGLTLKMGAKQKNLHVIDLEAKRIRKRKERSRQADRQTDRQTDRRGKPTCPAV